MNVKIVGLASDHAAFPLKQFVKKYLEEKGMQFKDYGTLTERVAIPGDILTGDEEIVFILENKDAFIVAQRIGQAVQRALLRH